MNWEVEISHGCAGQFVYSYYRDPSTPLSTAAFAWSLSFQHTCNILMLSVEERSQQCLHQHIQRKTLVLSAWNLFYRKIRTIKRRKNAEYQMYEDEGKSMVMKTVSCIHLILSAHVLISILVNPVAVQPHWLVPARRSLVSQNVSRIFTESTFRWLVCVHFSLLIVKWWQTYQHVVSGIIKQRLGIPTNPCTHLLGTSHFLCVYQLIWAPPSL